MQDRLIDLLHFFLVETGYAPLLNGKELYKEIWQRFPDKTPVLDEMTFEYLERFVVPHKIAVANAGFALMRQPWFQQVFGDCGSPLWYNLIRHDISKFCASECFTYAHFGMPEGSAGVTTHDFILAWHHHKVNNPHHPEHWWSVDRDGSPEVLPMPAVYVAEMIADWNAASETCGIEMGVWMSTNLHSFHFHESTAQLLKTALGNLGFMTEYWKMSSGEVWLKYNLKQ